MRFSLRDIASATPLVHSIIGTRALGIDIGSSSVKIVQLRRHRDGIILETYGEIALGTPGDAKRIEGTITSESAAGAILELMHEVKTRTYIAGVSIPSSSTLVLVVDMPNRDEEQIKRLIRSEAQKYIPAYMKDVLLDWSVIPDTSSPHNVFDAIKKETHLASKEQPVLLAAIGKEILNTYAKIMRASDISARFYEIEAFSGARSSLEKGSQPVLMIDLGATTSKISIVEQHLVRTLHPVNVGGEKLTQSLAQAMQWDLQKAEEVKCAMGLTPSAAYNPKDREKIAQTLTAQLDHIVSEAQLVMSTYHEQHKKDVVQIVLMGGGARLRGIEQYLQKTLALPVKLAEPFKRVRGPIVLEESLRTDGPIFANAIGLALRAVGA